MGQVVYLTYVFGIALQVLAIIHFAKRRPEWFWLWIILLFGGLGALVYLVVEAVPDLGLLHGQFQVMSHRKRIAELESLVIDNPAPGNYEELGDLYREKQATERNWAKREKHLDLVLQNVSGMVGDIQAITPQFPRIKRLELPSPR